MEGDRVGSESEKQDSIGEGRVKGSYLYILLHANVSCRTRSQEGYGTYDENG